MILLHSLIRSGLCRLQNLPRISSTVLQGRNHIISQGKRSYIKDGRNKERRRNNQNAVIYSTAGVLFALSASYAAVPLYRLYCQSTGKGGQAFIDDNSEKVSSMKPIKNRKLTVSFEADTESRMAWNFKPLQSEVKVFPGETALAFYTARNPLPSPVTGVATYSVMPFEAGLYFNKIQCFCFEEQRLNPGEEVDMPVFFYIDPEYAEDPRLENVENIVLSYVFFESKEGVDLPFLNQVNQQMEKRDKVPHNNVNK